MQIVINIPKEKYQGIINRAEEILDESTFCSPRYLYKAVLNGTTLPKGHGDLKDMSNFQYVFDLTRDDPIYSGKDIERAIKSMKSIIEADKETDDYYRGAQEEY